MIDLPSLSFSEMLLRLPRLPSPFFSFFFRLSFACRDCMAHAIPHRAVVTHMLIIRCWIWSIHWLFHWSTFVSPTTNPITTTCRPRDSHAYAESRTFDPMRLSYVIRITARKRWRSCPDAEDWSFGWGHGLRPERRHLAMLEQNGKSEHTVIRN